MSQSMVKSVFDKTVVKPPCTTEMYLSHEELEGETFFPHLPDAVYPTLKKPSLFALVNTSHYPIQMVYFNDNTQSTPSVYEKLGAYPTLSRTSTGGGAEDQVLDTSGYCWGMPEQPGLMLSLSTGSRVTTGNGKYHRNQFVVGDLTRCLQNQWIRPTHIGPRSTVTVSRHTPATTSRRLATRLNPTTPPSQAGVVPSLAQWCRDYPPWSQIQVAVRIPLLWNPESYEY